MACPWLDIREYASADMTGSEFNVGKYDDNGVMEGKRQK